MILLLTNCQKVSSSLMLCHSACIILLTSSHYLGILSSHYITRRLRGKNEDSFSIWIRIHQSISNRRKWRKLIPVTDLQEIDPPLTVTASKLCLSGGRQSGNAPQLWLLGGSRQAQVRPGIWTAGDGVVEESPGCRLIFQLQDGNQDPRRQRPFRKGLHLPYPLSYQTHCPSKSPLAPVFSPNAGFCSFMSHPHSRGRISYLVCVWGGRQTAEMWLRTQPSDCAREGSLANRLYYLPGSRT
ncbi:uncharacterized protein LOC144282334 [Canis aureus]